MIDRRVSAAARVREAMARLPPGVFLAKQALANPDEACACPPSQTLSATCVELALSALELTGSERVLEIGSISGYETVLLSQLAADVVSLVGDPASAAARSRVLTALGCRNVRTYVREGGAGWPREAPYQAIFIGGAALSIPSALLDQLELGGHLVIPLGDASGQVLHAVHRRADGITARALGPTRLPLLPWAKRRPSFYPWNNEGTLPQSQGSCRLS